MNIVKNKFKRTFAYTQIALHLEEKIASGELFPGSFLVSERKLADMYNVNHTTARKATQLLVDKGLVTKIQGQGILVTNCLQKQRATKFIAFILCKRKKSNPFYFELITYIEKELKKFGFHLVFSSLDSSSSERGIPKILMNSAVDGVIITGEVPKKLLTFLRKNQINHVLITHSDDYDGKSNIVASDDRDIGYKAANYLLKKHTQIAFIRGKEEFRPHDMLREDGFIQAFTECNRQFDKKMLVECSSYNPVEIRKTVSILLKKERPDAIFVTNINFVNETASVFRELGIKIPDEIEFVVFSEPEALHLTNITVPVIIKMNSQEISRAAVNRMLDIIHGRAVGISINLIPAIFRETIKGSIKSNIKIKKGER
jgi:DNA-binding LacI/PurR family transcriptional regulator